MHESGPCAWRPHDAKRVAWSIALPMAGKVGITQRRLWIERLRTPRIAAAAVEQAFM
jgi:hypothetical protein